MARPKLPNSLKKEKLNLTVSREVKEMLDFIRIEKSISISTFLEDAVIKEYKKLQKSGKVPEAQLHGQMNIDDLPKIDSSKQNVAFFDNATNCGGAERESSPGGGTGTA